MIAPSQGHPVAGFHDAVVMGRPSEPSLQHQPQEPDYAEPVAAFQPVGKSRTICNEFARAVRCTGWNAAEPNPIALKKALEITFLRSEFDERDILHTLKNAGLRAPVEAIPDKLQGFWADLHDRETPSTAFGSVGQGAKPAAIASTAVHNEALDVPPAQQIRVPQGLVYNLG